MSVTALARKRIAVVPVVAGAMLPMSSARVKSEAPFPAEARMLAASLDCGRPNRELLHRILAALAADEVEVALEHIAEEERKLAAEGIILDAEKATGSKEKQA